MVLYGVDIKIWVSVGTYQQHFIINSAETCSKARLMLMSKYSVQITQARKQQHRSSNDKNKMNVRYCRDGWIKYFSCRFFNFGWTREVTRSTPTFRLYSSVHMIILSSGVDCCVKKEWENSYSTKRTQIHCHPTQEKNKLHITKENSATLHLLTNSIQGSE